MKPYQAYNQFVTTRKENHLFRDFPVEQANVLDFSHNDYLNLSLHPNLIEAAIAATKKYGVGHKASRLLSNQQNIAKALEAQIANDKYSEAAIIFNSGFQANISVLASLLDAKILGAPPLVFADKLNHASIHSGIKLAGAKQIRYRHLDTEHLNWQLNKYKDARHPKFILTESIFGMDGDIANIAEIIKIAKSHKAFLYVDEAHATGILGHNGYGLSSDFAGEVDLTLGTFSKGLGCFGAYVACNNSIADFLMNHCQGLIYTTMPPPAQIAVMQAAWKIVPHLRTQVQDLLQSANNLRQNLQAMVFDTGDSQSHIIPIRLQTAERTLQAQQALKQSGILVSAIRPPSVSPKESRLRIALNLSHQAEDIQVLLQAFKQAAHQIDF
tara:strand:- start:21361 stop:22512 length:1152 start_codon:yes stop_codon:yes gene_type:complete